MSRGTKQRAFRCENELWDNAIGSAGERGDNLSEILRQALRQYVEDAEARHMLADAWDEGFDEGRSGDADSELTTQPTNPYRSQA